MAIFTGVPSRATTHGEGSWYGMTRTHKLLLLYLVIYVVHKSFPASRAGFKIGPLVTLAQIGIAIHLSGKKIHARPGGGGVPRAHLAHPRESSLVEPSPHLMLRSVAYSLLEEGLLRGVVQGKIKEIGKRYLSDRLSTCTAIATTALAAGVLAKVFPRSEDPIESHHLAVLAVSESVLAGVIADRLGVSASIAAKLAHNAACWSLEELHDFIRSHIR